MAAGDGRPQILIVPEQHSHSMERQLCAIGGSRVSLFAEVLSFTRLANRVFSVYGGLAAPALDGGGRLLLLCAALRSVAPELRVYQRPSRKPAFLSGLLATVDELKTCCITPEQLWTAGEESGGGEGDKLRDLSLIYGAYEAMTARQGADPRDRLTRLAEALTREDWAVGKDFYLDAFTDFTPQERAVLSTLLGKANSVTVALTCDKLEEDEGGAGIFSPARRTARQLLRLAQERGVSREIEVRSGGAGPKTAALAHLEGQLFAPRPDPWAGEAEALIRQLRYAGELAFSGQLLCSPEMLKKQPDPEMLEALDILLALSGRRLLEVSRNPPCKLSFLLQRGEDWIDSYAVMIVRQGYEREASLLLNQLAPETTLLLRLDDLGQHGALTVRQSCYFVVRQAGKLRFYKGGEARH